MNVVAIITEHITWFDKVLLCCCIICFLLLPSRSQYRKMLFSLIIAVCISLLVIHEYLVIPKLAFLTIISFLCLFVE